MKGLANMHIVPKSQWSGWFGGLGSGGVILQNVITAVTPFIVAGLAIWFAYYIFKIGGSLSKADGPEQRKEAKIKMGCLIGGLIVTIIGPTLILIFMNTIGKTVQTTAPTPTEHQQSLITSLSYLKIPTFGI